METLGGSISRSTPPLPYVALESDTPSNSVNDFSAYLRDTSDGTNHLGWYKPGHLPHFDTANICQLVTYRLADSLPQSKLQHFESELKNIDPKLIDSAHRKIIERTLDAGHGLCALKYPARH